jgi:Ca2+-binding RTX toxin-like protein
VDGNNGDDWLSGLNGEVDDFNTDFLNGGAGNDVLALGAGDYGTGGSGEDSFELHESDGETGLTQITDYDETLDQLVVHYDQTLHPDPVLSLTTDESGTQSTLFLDGTAIAIVNGGPVQVQDIRLVAA